MSENDLAATAERLNNLGHLSSGVGHHVINAFSAIVSNAELLRLKGTMPAMIDPATLADTIVTTALEAATVARRLIDYTRPVTSTDPDQSTLEPASIALDQLVARLVDEERAHAPGRVVLTTELTSVPTIRGHSFQLRAMLRHLLANAYEAMPRGGGSVHLTTTIDARGWVVLEMRDTGTGMASEVQVRAVEPFFSTKPGHFGVGLPIANGIWRRHRGTLSIRSQPGDGTTLRLCVEPFQG